MLTKDDIESFLVRLAATGATYSEVEPGFWIVRPTGGLRMSSNERRAGAMTQTHMIKAIVPGQVCGSAGVLRYDDVDQPVLVVFALLYEEVRRAASVSSSDAVASGGPRRDEPASSVGDGD